MTHLAKTEQIFYKYLNDSKIPPLEITNLNRLGRFVEVLCSNGLINSSLMLLHGLGFDPQRKAKGDLQLGARSTIVGRGIVCNISHSL